MANAKMTARSSICEYLQINSRVFTTMINNIAHYIHIKVQQHRLQIFPRYLPCWSMLSHGVRLGTFHHDLRPHHVQRRGGSVGAQGSSCARHAGGQGSSPSFQGFPTRDQQGGWLMVWALGMVIWITNQPSWDMSVIMSNERQYPWTAFKDEWREVHKLESLLTLANPLAG